MKIKVVLENMGARENGAKVQATRKYSFARPTVKLWSRHL